MSQQNAKKIDSLPSEADLKRSREKLEDAIERFESNLLMDIRMYLKQFKLTHLLPHAEEFYSELKIRALRNAGNYDPECSAKAWLRQAAFYMVQHLYRDSKKQPHTTSISDAAQNFGFDGNIKQASESELLDYLQQKSVDQFLRENKLNADEILSVVSAEERKLLKMRFVKGLSSKEIAANYGISDNAADVRLSRAKNSLKREFLKQ